MVVCPKDLIVCTPANDILNIKNIKAKTTCTLQNLIGTKMQQGTLNPGTNTISIKSISPGMYILELTDEDGKRTVYKIMNQ